MAVALLGLIITISSVFYVHAKLKRARLSSYGNGNGIAALKNSPADVIGYITGHTHMPELKKVGNKLFVNTGYGNIGLVRAPGKLGFPDAFAKVRNISFLELTFKQSQLNGEVTVISQRLGRANPLKTLLVQLPSTKQKTQHLKSIVAL
jgi:hypothetical protein